MKKFEFKYNYQEKLLTFEAKNNLVISDLLEMIEILAEYARYSKVLKVLLDLRFYYANYGINEQIMLMKTIREMVNKSCNIKIADIVNSPKETSFALIFSMDLKEIENIDFKIFCTREAGMNWLEN